MANPKGGRPRGGLPNPEVVAREQEVVRLRRGGLTWDMIGDRLGIHLTTARAAYERALKRVVQEDIEEIRKLEGERLDIAQAAIWETVLKGDNTSINTLIRIMERRAKLLGLDQPIKIQSEVITYDGDNVRAELARIVANANSRTPLSLGAGISESESVTAGE